MTEPKRPRSRGRPFPKGVSGNPSGRPSRKHNVEELARQYTEEAVLALSEALKDPRSRVAAAIALLDRGYGRPAQAHELKHHVQAAAASDADLLAIALSGSTVVMSEDDDETLH